MTRPELRFALIECPCVVTQTVTVRHTCNMMWYKTLIAFQYHKGPFSRAILFLSLESNFSSLVALIFISSKLVTLIFINSKLVALIFINRIYKMIWQIFPFWTASKLQVQYTFEVRLAEILNHHDHCQHLAHVAHAIIFIVQHITGTTRGIERYFHYNTCTLHVPGNLSVTLIVHTYFNKDTVCSLSSVTTLNWETNF